jgi:hypothetical protein
MLCMVLGILGSGVLYMVRVCLIQISSVRIWIFASVSYRVLVSTLDWTGLLCLSHCHVASNVFAYCCSFDDDYKQHE